MEYHLLGRTGVKISRLGLGTMSFGKEADETTAAAMFRRCRDVGINCFDCANGYAGGRAEEILGRLIADCRNDIILSTKVGHHVGQDVNAGGLSRRHLMEAVEGSLRRLKTDRIDLYFLHYFDSNTPLDETLRALDDLVRQGKVIYTGASNCAAWQIMKALGISGREGFARFQCIQPMYSLIKRQAEVEILPMAQAEQLGVITYSPLGAGLLTGKFGTGRKPEHGRVVDNRQYALRYAEPGYYEVAERFGAHTETQGIHPATLAVAWVMSHPAVTAPLIGARSLEQLEYSLAALDVQMTPEWRATISALSPEPPPATDRSDERSPA